MRRFLAYPLIILSFILLNHLPLHVSAQEVVDSVQVEIMEPSLKDRLDSIIRVNLPLGGQVGVYAYDLTSDSSLYEYQIDALSRPASTMKLLTAITALDQDPSARAFETKVYADGPISNGTLEGNLWVVGGFDPEFMDEDMDVLIQRLKDVSITRINGHIYGDASLKDSLYWGSGWLWDDTPNTYQPYLSTLMFNKDKVDITIRPTQKGSAASVQIKPVSSFYTVENQTRTSTPGRGPLTITRDWLNSSNKIILKGNVTARRVGDLNLQYTERFFMQTFVDRLASAGISFEKTYQLAAFTQTEDSWVVASFQTPFQDVLDEMLKESDNLNAEAMLWRIGHNAKNAGGVSASDGLEVIRDLMSKIGLNPKDYRIADGCGLSMYDYISPRVLVGFLNYAFRDSAIFSKLYKALPVSGVDGTLKNRMKAEMLRKVHAKTGSYTGINCLSGYLMTSDQHQLSFAIMCQNILSAAEARSLQDAICKELFMSSK